MCISCCSLLASKDLLSTYVRYRFGTSAPFKTLGGLHLKRADKLTISDQPFPVSSWVETRTSRCCSKRLLIRTCLTDSLSTKGIPTHHRILVLWPFVWMVSASKCSNRRSAPKATRCWPHCWMTHNTTPCRRSVWKGTSNAFDTSSTGTATAPSCCRTASA
eukprot:s79_g17.t1